MPVDAYHTTASIAQRLGAELVGRGDLAICGVNSMADAGPDQITFISSAAYARAWPRSQAAAAVVTSGLTPAGHDPAQRALLVVPNAELAMMALLEDFAPPAEQPPVGCHETAVIDPDAQISATARIGPHVSVGRGSVIHDHVTLHAGVRIGAQVVIGEHSVLFANTVVRDGCTLGRRVCLHGNVMIGADGFGYRPSPDGSSLIKVPHIGNVEIGDDVEIGASSCIDRGKFSATVIGAGTKIDNLVQIAHNCRIGRGCVIAGQTGLAGSVTVGDNVQIGAQAGIAEGRSIGAGARIGARAGVMDDIPAGMTAHGIPAVEAREALRQAASIRKLPRLIQALSRRAKGRNQ